MGYGPCPCPRRNVKLCENILRGEQSGQYRVMGSGGVTEWYQSFSLRELSIDCSLPRHKLDKLRIMSPTSGRVLGGENVLSHTEVYESELRWC